MTTTTPHAAARYGAWDRGGEPDTALVRLLSNFVPLSADERACLTELTTRARAVAARTDLIAEGETVSSVLVILDGFACRYTHLANGRRQILGFLLPGDVGDVDLRMYGHPNIATSTLTACRVAQIPSDALLDLIERRPRIGQALRIDKLVAEARMRDWLVSLGSRTAAQRTAHLLHELLERLAAVGLANEGSCDLPIKQTDLADALGLSTVHVNRTLQTLRAMKLIELRGKRLRVNDLSRVQRFAAGMLDAHDPVFVPKPAQDGLEVR